jgi:hypothetical protein
MMTAKQVPDFLALKNPHPRDEFISFEEGPHIYTVLGERGTYTSVTTWIHSHFSDFDADGIIDKMMVGKNWNDPTYKYYGMTREQIKGMWDKKRDLASGAGTNMHYDIECYYNEMNVVNDSIEYSYFMEFTKDHSELKAYRTEWTVYYEEAKLSGSIDMIFENPDGTIQIYDWKRSEEIKYETGFNKSASTDCINHLPDSNFWHYSLQLNIYRKILEDKYGKKVTGLYLVCLHPNNHNKSYQLIEVPFLDKEVNDLFELRKQQVLSGTHNIKKH